MAAAGGHPLSVAGEDDRTCAQAILVLKLAFEDVGDNLHVAMGMSGEAGSSNNHVLINDAQGAKTHEAGVVVQVEGEV